MKAIILNQPGAQDQLMHTELPEPIPQSGEVVIKTAALSINPVDVKTRNGKGIYGRIKNESPLILGWDVSGIVTATGPNTTRFKIGDEVFGMVNFPGHGRAYAQYVCAPETHLARKPKNIGHEAAAAAALAALTAWQALVTTAQLKPAARVLIHAAAGGVGHFAVQIARHCGAYVIGTASANKRSFLLSLGADEHIDYQEKPFEETTSGVDVVLDCAGGAYGHRSLTVMNPGGQLISIAGGVNETVTEKAKLININALGILVQSSAADMETLAALLEKEIIKPHISATFPFHKMQAAHQLLEGGRTIGKIIITM